ncbi:unnamed protein product [Paramecium octaurelia]|uniref:Autophagy-related protein n=1 Tax=Paramecium octaurelia TaxID=43137 RepID=A0A8S1X0K0_PAROT|nr:unnamed protein product [Paramecium octaurelia]
MGNNAKSRQNASQNDTPYNYFENRPLANRRELSEKYTAQSEVVVVCEPLKQKNQTSDVVGPKNQMFLFILNKKVQVISLFSYISQHLSLRYNRTVMLFCNSQFLSFEDTIGIIYEKNKNQEDGFLYVQYNSLEIC